jgi:hypothetical protein
LLDPFLLGLLGLGVYIGVHLRLFNKFSPPFRRPGCSAEKLKSSLPCHSHFLEIVVMSFPRVIDAGAQRAMWRKVSDPCLLVVSLTDRSQVIPANGFPIATKDSV